MNELWRQAVEVMKQEAKAITYLAENPPSNLSSVLDIITKCSGRIIVSGIGKSAIIGQKIAATFNSTGTAALFLHGADALHGDIGMVQAQDLILLLSKSGDTDELKAMVPTLKNMGNIIVSMTCNASSYLANQSHYHLLLPMVDEADPNNLAPTTSTSLQLVMGDALAIALLTNKGFSREQFATFHPGGNLGKQLYTRVGDLCHRIPLPYVSNDSTLQEVILSMSSGRMGATVVTSSDLTISGLITDGDLRRLLMKENIDIHKLTAREIMTPSPKRINEKEMAVEAFSLMRKYSITQLPVTGDHESYVGMIHLHDLIKEGFC